MESNICSNQRYVDDLNKDLGSKNNPRSSTLEKSTNRRKWRPRHIPQKKKKKKNKKSKYKPSDESLKALCYTSDDCLPKKGFQEFCSRSGLHFQNTKFEINIVIPLMYDIAQ